MDLSGLIPDDHLLRRISRVISFDFIYELLEPYYPSNGRPSVDPVSMFKMLLVGYLYGIKSERRLVQEVQLNIGYLMETTVDCKYGIITNIDVYPANEKESLLVLRHLERQVKNGVPKKNIALDRGYNTGAVHRGLELLDITGYIPAMQFSNSPEKYGFSYLPKEDAFSCTEEVRLVYQRLNCSQTTGKYLRCCQVQGDACKTCKRQPTCFKLTGIRRRNLGSSCYPAFYRGNERIGSDIYWHMMRLCKIWAKGSFAVLKREHCLSKVRKRGISAVTEECLLSVMALNLKRIVKAIFLFLSKTKKMDWRLFSSPSFILSTAPLLYLICFQGGTAKEPRVTRDPGFFFTTQWPVGTVPRC